MSQESPCLAVGEALADGEGLCGEGSFDEEGLALGEGLAVGEGLVAGVSLAARKGGGDATRPPKKANRKKTNESMGLRIRRKYSSQ